MSSERDRLREILGEFVYRLDVGSYGPQDTAAEQEKAIDAIMELRQTTDPREAGGDTISMGGSGDRGLVTYDSRRAVLVHQFVVSVAHPQRHGEPQADVVALQAYGRINRPPDDPEAPPVPEQVEILQMAAWDLAADLVANLHALAARDGSAEAFTGLVKAAWGKLAREGHTREAPG